MGPESVTTPGEVDRFDLDTTPPAPEACLPPGETTVARADLSPGWIAVSERELLVYHPDRDPPVGRILRPNVTGVALRRVGGRRLLGYVPTALLFAVGGVLVGLLLLSIEPTTFVSLPRDMPLDSFSTIVQSLGWAMDVLGAMLVFSAILSGVGAATVAGYWLLSREVVIAIERGSAESIECPATRAAGQRAVRTLRETMTEADGPHGSEKLDV